MTSFLLRGGCVLSLSSKVGNHLSADLLIEGDRITEVGQKLRAPRGTEVVDASDTIIMPGFVDAHRHVWESLFCNLGDQESLADAPSAAAIYGPHHTAEDIYAATMLGLLGSIEAGTTTVVDIYDGPSDLVDAARQAHADSGIRTVLVPTPPSWAEFGDWPGLVRNLAGASSSRNAIAAGSIDPTSSNIDSVAEAWGHARGLGMRIHAHAGRDPSGQGVVASLGERGLLADDLTFAHITHTNPDDLDAISKSGVGVVLTPSSEMAGGLGTPPLQDLLDRSIRPGLGVDGERIAPGDMFAQMRAVISLQHAAYFDRKLAGKGGLPRLLTTRETIRYATSDGARVAGLGSITGTLEPGKQADIVVLRADRPNIAPVNDPIGAVVWGMDTSNVDWVFVAGEAVKRDGALVADAGQTMTAARAAQRRIAALCGLEAAVGVAG